MNTQRGYTLIELLVVIALILIMTGIVLANLSPNRRLAELEESTNDIISFIRAARQNAVTVLEHPSQAGTYPSYGVVFDTGNPSTIIMYADCEPDDNGDDQIELIHDRFHHLSTNCGGDDIIETLTLKHGHEIQSISVTTVTPPIAPAGYDEYHLLYIRPEPQVWHVGGNGGTYDTLDAGETRITLVNGNGTETRTIYLNSLGLIYVE